VPAVRPEAYRAALPEVPLEARVFPRCRAVLPTAAPVAAGVQSAVRPEVRVAKQDCQACRAVQVARGQGLRLPAARAERLVRAAPVRMWAVDKAADRRAVARNPRSACLPEVTDQRADSRARVQVRPAAAKQAVRAQAVRRAMTRRSPRHKAARLQTKAFSRVRAVLPAAVPLPEVAKAADKAMHPRNPPAAADPREVLQVASRRLQEAAAEPPAVRAVFQAPKDPEARRAPGKVMREAETVPAAARVLWAARKLAVVPDAAP